MTDHIDIEALRNTYPIGSADQWEAEGRHSLAEQRRDFHRVLDALEAMQEEPTMTNEHEWLRELANNPWNHKLLSPTHESCAASCPACALYRVANTLEAMQAERDNAFKWAKMSLEEWNAERSARERVEEDAAECRDILRKLNDCYGDATDMYMAFTTMRSRIHTTIFLQPNDTED